MPNIYVSALPSCVSSFALLMSCQYATTLAGRSGRGDIFDLSPLKERMKTGRREKTMLRGAVHSSQSTSPESGQCRLRAHFLHASGSSTSTSTALTSPVSSWAFLIPSLQRSAKCGNQRQFMFEVRRRLPLLEDELAEASLKYVIHWLRIFRDAGVCLPLPSSFSSVLPSSHLCPRRLLGSSSSDNSVGGERGERETSSLVDVNPSPWSIFLLSFSSRAPHQESENQLDKVRTEISAPSSFFPRDTSMIPLSSFSLFSPTLKDFTECKDQRLCHLHAHIIDIVEHELMRGEEPEEINPKGVMTKRINTELEQWRGEPQEDTSTVCSPTGVEKENEVGVLSAETARVKSAPRKSRKERERIMWRRRWKEDLIWHQEMAKMCAQQKKGGERREEKRRVSMEGK